MQFRRAIFLWDRTPKQLNTPTPPIPPNFHAHTIKFGGIGGVGKIGVLSHLANPGLN
jgi:hypothetical protein